MTHPVDAKLITAIITPFRTDGVVDYPALERVTQHLIDTGSDGILVNGSTGENPTTTADEKRQILRTVRQVIGDQPIALIAGTGTNDTQTTIVACQEAAQEEGVDALLVVVPYYNKPSQAGMIAHYGAIAEAVDFPMIIYNIPGRSIVSMAPETMAAIHAAHPQWVGVKQSHPDMDQVSDIAALLPPTFRIWCGDDSLTLPMMALGAYGAFSVAAHLVGPVLRTIIEAMDRGDLATARQAQYSAMTIFKEIFCLPNPTPIKACLAEMGLIENVLRLPLIPADATTHSKMVELTALVQKVSNA